MAVKLTSRDALVVFLTGSSNASGQQSEPLRVFSETQVPAVLPNSFFWNRYVDATNRVLFATNPPNDWDPITPLLNFQEDGPSPMYFLAREMEAKYFGAKRAAHGTPKAIYFIHMAFSSSNMTLDVSDIAASVAFNPYSTNFGKPTPGLTPPDPPWQIWAEGYCKWALKELEADASIDNIYIDGAYFLGNETAAAASGGASASEESRFTLATGIIDWCREMENFCGLPRGTMPFIQVILPRQTIGSALITSLTEIEDVRDQMFLAQQVAENPMASIDGDRYQMQTDHAHWNSDSVARIGIDLFKAREAMGAPATLKENAVATEVQKVDQTLDITP